MSGEIPRIRNLMLGMEHLLLTLEEQITSQQQFGYNHGYTNGQAEGYAEGLTRGKAEGYDDGYREGFRAAIKAEGERDD